MDEVFLIICMIGVFALGYFLVKRLDAALSVQKRSIEREEEKQSPSCVMLTDGLTDEEIAEEIRRFRDDHSDMKVFLCSGGDAPPDSFEPSDKCG